MLSDKSCAVCNGEKVIKLLGSECPFCNGTGEPSQAARSYMESHTCQCIYLDRMKCPLCGKKCHHDTPNKPKIEQMPM